MIAQEIEKVLVALQPYRWYIIGGSVGVGMILKNYYLVMIGLTLLGLYFVYELPTGMFEGLKLESDEPKEKKAVKTKEKKPVPKSEEGFTNTRSQCTSHGYVVPASNLNTTDLNYSAFNEVDSNWTGYTAFEQIYDQTYKSPVDPMLTPDPNCLPEPGPMWTPDDVLQMQRGVVNNAIPGHGC